MEISNWRVLPNFNNFFIQGIPENEVPKYIVCPLTFNINYPITTLFNKFTSWRYQVSNYNKSWFKLSPRIITFKFLLFIVVNNFIKNFKITLNYLICLVLQNWIFKYKINTFYLINNCSIKETPWIMTDTQPLLNWFLP